MNIFYKYKIAEKPHTRELIMQSKNPIMTVIFSSNYTNGIYIDYCSSVEEASNIIKNTRPCSNETYYITKIIEKGFSYKGKFLKETKNTSILYGEKLK